MNSSPLRVLVASEDRKLLRQTSRFLNMFGYQVQQVAEMQRPRTVLEGRPPHVLILDAAAGAEVVQRWCQQAAHAAESGYIYTLLLVEEVTSRGLVDAMAAGADDFLQTPIGGIELLARLRSAARAIELERRTRQQEGVDPLTRMSNRESFGQSVRRESTAHSDLACVAADLDLLDQINRVHGHLAGNEVIRAFAAVLKQIGGDTALLGCFGAGRFAALLTDSSMETAQAWARRARQAVADLQVPYRETVLRATASFGIAAGTHEQLIRRAEEALMQAKRSGRDCIVCDGQFDDEAEAWKELATSGRLFEQTVAHHVMAPLPVLLHVDDTAARAKTILKDTRLDALVVVDSNGRLAGVVSSECDLADPDARVAKVMLTDVVTFAEDTPLSTLLEFFTKQPEPRAVISAGERPLGMVTSEQLATLTDVVTEDRFAPCEPYSAGSDYLVVVDRVLTGSTW